MRSRLVLTLQRTTEDPVIDKIWLKPVTVSALTHRARTLVLVWLVFGIASTALAQTAPSQAAGTIHGEVTTQRATIPLGGVEVVLARAGVEVARASSEGDGKYRFENLPPGEYTVRAGLEGFSALTATVQLSAGGSAELKLDLQLSEQVRVVEPERLVSPTGTLAGADSLTQAEVEQIAPGGGLQAAFRLLASVIEVPGGLAIKGGLPNQASMQIGPGLFVDPATGLTQGSLPDDAIESVTVMPNPYAVEFGRFSSGLVVIQTRRGEDQWKTRISQLEPSFRTRRDKPFTVQGLRAFSPRMETGGPLKKDKVFLHLSAQYRYRASEVESRPEDEIRTSHRLGVFSRVDANLSDNHSLMAVAGVFPSRSKFATLGTFTPPDATANLHNDVQTLAVTERTVWSDTRFAETTVEINRFNIDVRPQGSAPMDLLPETTLGNFFNRQERTAATYQIIHALSGTSQTRFGLQMYKAGIDLLRSEFDVVSESRPILIRRSDGSLARRLDFGPRTAQAVNSTDFALFFQDRIQPNGRWYIELGARLDRDGIIDRFNVTPRVGSALLLTRSGSAVVRGGYGLFFERTPSTVGAFQGFETAVETRYADDGMTPLGPATAFVHTPDGDLRTPRSSTWDLAYDHRFNPRWSIHAGAIDRRGSHEYIVDRVTGATVGTLSPGGTLQLRSAGRSRYREIDVGVNFTAGTLLDLKATYVRSHARADLNAFSVYYDSVLQPVFGENAYGPARTDVPHRLLARWRAMPTPSWLFVGVADWRAGLPYSLVDEALDFVGPRNSARFPNYFRLDLGVDRRIRIFNLRPWVGVRIDNALNAFLPADVQANISSPAFRTFYNSELRQFRIQFRFAR
jgi:hypothetical protein